MAMVRAVWVSDIGVVIYGTAVMGMMREVDRERSQEAEEPAAVNEEGLVLRTSLQVVRQIPIHTYTYICP